MPSSFSGGCACGAIRYECSSEPIAMINCHCRDCQRSSGGAYAPAVIVPGDALRLLSGTPKYYESRADSGNLIQRGFCPECGSPLFGKSSAASFVGIKVGSLDDPSWFKPMADIWIESAQPWDEMAANLPKFPKAPPVPPPQKAR